MILIVNLMIIKVKFLSVGPVKEQEMESVELLELMEEREN